MATFGFDFPGPMPGRLLAWLGVRRKSLAGRSATVRWSLAALAVGCLSLAGYLAASSLAPGEPSYLGAGRRYSTDDLVKIARALDKQGVSYQQMDDRRIAVAADALDAAVAAVAKLDIGPRTLEELREEAGKSSIWETPHDKEVREQREQARVFERLINDLPGVDGSFVSINRPRQRLGLRPTVKPTAFVRVETEGGRELPFGVIESITAILTVSESGLSPRSITVMDRSGRTYLDAGNPALNALSTTRAREEELSRRIHEKLDWITGVGVDVRLVIAEPEEQPAPVAAETKVDPGLNDGATPTSPDIAVGVNQAMSIDLEPADPAPPAASPAAPPEPVAPEHRGRIWVRVPRSYYYNASFVPGHHEPSQDDIRALMVRTESHIRKAVELVIPESRTDAWDPVSIDVIQDELPIDRVPTVVSSNGSRRLVNDWAAAGAAGAAAAALVAVGTWIFSVRQPARRSASSRGSLRYHRGSPSTPPPTERVLEFVRRNPEAAFSVLNRWTSQGGGRS